MAQAIFAIVFALSLFTLLAVLKQAARVVRERGAAEMSFAFTTVAGGVFTQTSIGTGSNGIRIVIAVLSSAAGLMMLVSRHRSGQALTPGRPAAAVLAFVLWMWLFVTDLAVNHLSATVLGNRAISGGLWVLIIAITMAGALSLETFAIAGTATLALIGLTLPIVPMPWLPCTQFKCPAAGQLLAGPFTSENYLAMQAVFIGVLAATALSGRLRIVATTLAVVVVYATGSRTSLLILAVCGALMLGSFARGRLAPARAPRASWPPAVVAAAAAMALGLFLLFTAQPDSFSRRGAVWMQGLAALHGRALFGTGADRWEVLRAAGLVPDHFTHSVYLLVFFSGGAVGVALFGAWAAVVLHNAARDSRTPVADMVLGIAFLGIGMTEVVWNPLSFDSLSWAAIALSSGSRWVRGHPGDADLSAVASMQSEEGFRVGAT